MSNSGWTTCKLKAYEREMSSLRSADDPVKYGTLHLFTTRRVNCGRFSFWRRQSVFCLCMKYLGNRWTDLRHIHTEDVFGPSLGRV